MVLYFTSRLVLFGPPLLLLAYVLPCVVKFAIRELTGIGRTRSAFSDISSIGSIFMTLLADFLFESYLGVDKIFYLVGMMLDLDVSSDRYLD